MTQKRRSWSSRSLGTPFGHGIFYFLIRLGGRPAAYLLLYFVVLYFMCKPSVRRKAYPYLQRRFPKSSRIALLARSYKLSLEFGKTLVDRAVAGILGDLVVHAREEDKRHVLDLLKLGKGVIFITAHAGCWQTGMAGLEFAQRDVSILYRRDPGDVDRHWFEHAGRENPFRFIDPDSPFGGALEMMETLRQGQVLALMADRMLEGAGIAAEFLGDRILLPAGPFKIAAASGAPVVVVFFRRRSDAQPEIHVVDTLHIPQEHGKRLETLQPYAQRYAQALEDFIQNNPYQFFNFYDMWQG